MKSNLKLFTPQANKQLQPTNVEQLIPCVLTGADRYTILHVKPGQVKRSIAKYALVGQNLIVPKNYDLSAESDVIVAVEKPEKTETTPENVELIICLNTGNAFEGRKAVAQKFRMTPQLLGGHLRGKSSNAKGYVFRLATPQEKEEYQAGAWSYSEPLIPVVPTRKLKAR